MDGEGTPDHGGAKVTTTTKAPGIIQIGPAIPIEWAAKVGIRPEEMIQPKPATTTPAIRPFAIPKTEATPKVYRPMQETAWGGATAQKAA